MEIKGGRGKGSCTWREKLTISVVHIEVHVLTVVAFRSVGPGIWNRRIIQTPKLVQNN
jgi:hypothetical protein